MKDTDISLIKPYKKNAKQHEPKQVEQIAKSIREFGFNQPIVVDKKGVIIVGHGRYLAAQFLGLKKVPVLTVELSPEQAKAYRLADNKLNESDWDMELVIEEIKELSVPMIELTGFDPLIINGEFNFKNKELDELAIDQSASEHKTRPCPNCGYEF